MRRTGPESATHCWMLSFFTQKPVNSRLVLESIWGRRFSIPQSDSKARFVLDIQIQIRDVSVSLSFLFRSLSFFLFLSLCLGQDESQSTPGQMVKWTRSSGELISDSWERWTPLKRRRRKKKKVTEHRDSAYSSRAYRVNKERRRCNQIHRWDVLQSNMQNPKSAKP